MFTLMISRGTKGIRGQQMTICPGVILNNRSDLRWTLPIKCQRGSKPDDRVVGCEKILDGCPHYEILKWAIRNRGLGFESLGVSCAFTNNLRKVSVELGGIV